MHPSESAGGTHDIPLPYSFLMFSLDSISITQSKQVGCLQDKHSIQNDKALAKWAAKWAAQGNITPGIVGKICKEAEREIEGIERKYRLMFQVKL